MTDADVAKILAHTPKLKGYDVSSVVHPKVAFLRDELGAPADKLRAAIKREPRLLVVGLPSLVVTAEYFRDEIGVPKNKLGAMLCKQPSLAWASVPEKLRPVVAFLGDELGMSPAAVADVASRAPERATDERPRYSPSEGAFLRRRVPSDGRADVRDAGETP